jgi:protein disulfide-isomerase
MRKILIGKIYANWCGHCQRLKPEWLKMKQQLKNKMKKLGYFIEFIEIEESEQEKLTKFKQRFPNLNINGYPTIFKHTGGNEIEYYQGERSASELEKWVFDKNTIIMGGKKKINRKSRTIKNRKSRTIKNRKSRTIKNRKSRTIKNRK